MALRRLNVTADKQAKEAGRYVRPASVEVHFIPSSIECPYCKQLLLEMTSGPVAITRMDAKGGETVGTILPSHVKAYSCPPCSQRFCIDTHQEAWSKP